MEANVMETDVQVALLRDAVDRMEKTVGELCVLLRGNGDSIGIKGRVDALTKGIKILFAVNGAVALVFVSAIITKLWG